MDVLLKSFLTKLDKRQFKDSKDSNKLLNNDIEKLDDEAKTMLESTRRNKDHAKDVNTKSPRQNEIDAARREIHPETNREVSEITDRFSSMCQPLLGSQPFWKDLIIDGKFIRGMRIDGIFIHNKTIELHDSFEIEIVFLGKVRHIAIGVVPCVVTSYYCDSLGLQDGTFGYRSDGTVRTNGRKVCVESGHLWRVGDRIRCIIRLGSNTAHSLQQFVSFTRNGTVIHEDWMPPGNYRFAISMRHQGGKIRVTHVPAE